MKKTIKKKQWKWPIIIVTILITTVMIGMLFRNMTYKISNVAVSNLTGSVSMLKGTMESLLEEDEEALSLVAGKTAEKEDMKAWFDDFCTTNGMSGIVLVKPDENTKIAGSGTDIPVEKLDFSKNKKVDKLLISASYMNSGGEWAYALRCPVMKDDVHVADVIAEYTWNHIYQSMTSNLYGEDSSVLVYDHLSGKMVVQTEDSVAAVGELNDLDAVISYAETGDAKEKKMVIESIEKNEMYLGDKVLHGQEQMIYMWPVNQGTAYLMGIVPVASIMGEIPIVKQIIIFSMSIIAICTCLVGITFGVFSLKEKKEMQKVGEEREVHNQKLQEALDKAEKANASKMVFLSNMSHDMRTPLNGIMGLLKIEEMHPDDIRLVKENRKKMQISAEYLLSLVNDVLQMSKLEDGNIVLTHEFMNLQELSVDIVTIIGERAAQKGITLTYEQDENDLNVPYVYTSPLHLRQLFLNIYINCIKYNKVGGIINTSFKCVKKSLKTSVYEWVISDTGIGMSEEFQKHIFEPFSQERSDARSVYNGVGLGMAIVKKIVDALQGTIEVKSKEGEGSSFRITLPFEMAEEKDIVEKQKKAEEPVKEYNIRGVRILMAEDNGLNAEIAETLLEDQGAEVAVVGNGEEAVESFRNHPPGTFDVILMDIMMPVMDGMKATKEIRSTDREDANKIPIIAMTANAFEEDERKCLEVGMNAYLCKPLQIEKMVEVIANCRVMETSSEKSI